MKVVTAMPWLILVSLIVALGLMLVWWNASSIQVNGSTTFIFMFATTGLWVSLFLAALALWRLLQPRSNDVKQSANA